MSEFRRRLMMNYVTRGGSYTPLEWIGSDDKAYIDTGIVINDNSKIEASFVYTKFVQYGGLCSDYISDNNDATRIILRDNKTSFNFKTPPIQDGIDINLVVPNVHCIYTFDKSSIQIYDVNLGKVVASRRMNTNSNNDNKSSLRIFRPNLSKTRDVGARCYGFKYFENDKLLKDFIPVLDASGIPCMYEKIEGKFYYNKGVGEFTYQHKIKYNETIYKK